MRYVEAKIKKFQKRFNDLKKATRVCLAERRISVKLIVNSLALMLADENEEHRLFLRDHLTDLYQSPDPSELFGKLSFLHWDYLSYQLLDYLIKEFELKVDKAMETYKDDLRRFREKTPLALFCQTQKRRRRKPSEEFQEVVAEFDWPHNATLDDVEQFRQEYSNHYCLRECTMMLAEVCPGSFIVTWFIPQSVVDVNLPKHIIAKFCLVSLTIAGVTVFPPMQVNHLLTSIVALINFSVTPIIIMTQQNPATEKPSGTECPVTAVDTNSVKPSITK